MPIVCYGLMLFGAGLTISGTSAVIGFMQGVDLLSLAVLDLPMMISGIVVLLMSFPFLLVENQPLSRLVQNSRFGSKFLCGFLGLDPISIRRPENVNLSGGWLFALSLLIGVGIGVVTRYVSVILIPLILLIIVIIAIVMTAPEAGLMLLGVLLPLLNPKQLSLFMLLVVFSFMVKLLRGKRSLKLTLTDIAFLILAAVIFFHSLFSETDSSFSYMAVLCCLIAVIGSHLLRSHGVAMRFLRALMFSAFLSILALGIDIGLQYAPAFYIRDIPLSLFSQRIITNFGSRSGVGLYLFFIFPFVMTSYYMAGKLRIRFRYLIY